MELSDIVKAAFEKAYPGEDFGGVRVLPATDPKFGDYQCNDALKFAKKAHANPREVGAKVAEALKNAEAARKRGIPIFTVGIGDPKRGATIPAEDGRGVQKFDGKPVTVKLEESALKAIAEASKGAYVPLATAGTAETTLGAIYRRRLRQIALMEQNEEESRLGERYQIFLVPGLVLLLVGAALSKGRFAKRKAA